MSDSIPGFVKINAVADGYATSRKTVERRRDQARERGESRVYRMFKLRTRDGEIIEQPSLERVKTLRSNGRVPEWFVSRRWLDKEFGKRRDEPSRHTAGQSAPAGEQGSADALAALKEQYESTISLLQQQLLAEKEEKRDLLRYAQEDKKLFANVAAQLSRAVPALEAVNKQAQPPLAGTTVEAAEPTRPRETPPRQKAPKPKSKQTSKGFWPGLFRSRQSSRQ